MTVIARFVDERRARRMKGWLRLCHIPSRLRFGDDGRIELSVRTTDEPRALDLLCTIVLGLDIGHLNPTSARERYLEAENLIAGAVGALAGLVIGVISMFFVPVFLALGVLIPVLGATVGFLVGSLGGLRRDGREWRSTPSPALPAWAAELSVSPRRRSTRR